MEDSVQPGPSTASSGEGRAPGKESGNRGRQPGTDLLRDADRAQIVARLCGTRLCMWQLGWAYHTQRTDCGDGAQEGILPCSIWASGGCNRRNALPEELLSAHPGMSGSCVRQGDNGVRRGPKFLATATAFPSAQEVQRVFTPAPEPAPSLQAWIKAVNVSPAEVRARAAEGMVSLPVVACTAAFL